jgi:hypothetical protein
MSHNLFVKTIPSHRLLIFLFMLLPLGLAQGKTGWKAWVVYGSRLYLVDSTGMTQAAGKLPLGKRITPVMITPNGQNAVFAVAGYPPQPTALLFYDLAARRVRRQYALSALPTSLMVNEYGTAVSLTLATTETWSIAVIDLFTGKTVYTLPWNSDLFDAEPDRSDPPHLRQYLQGRVTFTLPGGKGYTWNTINNTLTPNPAFANENGDYLPQTGEVVFPLCDGRFPQHEFDNTLQVYDPLRGSLYPFYSAGRPGLARVWFIQGGERLLVKQADNTWLILERNGEPVGQWPAPAGLQVDDIHSINDGFIYTASLNGISLPEIVAVDTRQSLDAGKTVWNVPLDQLASRFDTHETFHILWVNEAAHPTAFLNWAQIAEPNAAATDETPSIQPTALPSLFPALAVGMEVRVQTVGGEILNLRRGPGRKYAVVRYLRNKERLFLLEGPKEVDGLSWWRVSAADGAEGWAVENDGRLQTLIPM